MISRRYQNDSLPTLDLNAIQLDLKHKVEEKIKSGRYQFEQVNCAICEGYNFQQLADKDRYGLYCSNVVCRDCGLVMINPRMTEASYNEFYNQEYRALYSGVKANAANFFAGQNARGKRLYGHLGSQGLLPDLTIGTPFLLEIGCGAGGILNFFKGKGFEVKGIDLGEEYLAYGRDQHGLDLELGSLSDLELSRKPDLVIYSHVLEHVLDLNQELTLLQTICSANTLIYVEVPGLKNLATGYRNDPLRYFQNAHCYSFSLTSLRNLFAKHNFELIHGNEFVKATFQSSGAPTSDSIENDYQQVIESLKSAESRRKYYFISWARIKVITRYLLGKLKTK